MKLLHIFLTLLTVSIIACGSPDLVAGGHGGGASTTVTFTLSKTQSGAEINGKINPAKEYNGKLEKIQICMIDETPMSMSSYPNSIKVDSLGCFTGSTPQSGMISLYIRDLQSNKGTKISTSNTTKVYKDTLKTLANIKGKIDSPTDKHVVSLARTPYSTTPTNGNFVIANIPQGTYLLRTQSLPLATGTTNTYNPTTYTVTLREEAVDVGSVSVAQ